MPAIGGRQHHRISFNTLKSLLINHLSTVYPHYVSKNTIMSFSTRFSMEDEIFAVTAIAELRPPTWLAEEGTEIVLEDNFLVTCSETSYWDALEQMWEYIGGVEENEEEKRSQGTFMARFGGCEGEISD